jgi:hypothetical protein
LYVYMSQYVCVYITVCVCICHSMCVYMSQYVCEEHFQRLAGRSIFTGLVAKTHFGRPNFVKLLQAVSGKHKKVFVTVIKLNVGG